MDELVKMEILKTPEGVKEMMRGGTKRKRHNKVREKNPLKVRADFRIMPTTLAERLKEQGG